MIPEPEGPAIPVAAACVCSVLPLLQAWKQINRTFMLDDPHLGFDATDAELEKCPDIGINSFVSRIN